MCLITVAEAQELLGLGRTKIYQLIKENKLPVVRSFGPVRIHKGRLLAMIEEELKSHHAANARTKDADVQQDSRMELDELLKRRR